MYKFKEENMKIPAFVWSDPPDNKAIEQIVNISSLPFAFHHVAIMPDCHMGYGMPIGGVLATNGVIVPNCIGVDIGCGMTAVKISLSEIDIATLKKIMGKIREVIPTGFEHHKEKQNEKWMPSLKDVCRITYIVFQEYSNALTQIGTLGGGNHFIEIQKGSDGYIYIMIHSGSRNLGKKVADHYNKIAKQLNERWFSSVPKEWDLAFLPIETKEAKDYFDEMKYCVNFAFRNRELMMSRILEIFIDEFPMEFNHDPIINIAHNYARWENHYGKNIIIHRKGATSAKEGEIGIIPGSQGSKSYIVEGLGNKESFESCSHGAGRAMGRNEATKKLNLEEEIKKLDDQGIIHGIRNIKDLDEAVGAYKAIDKVMENQMDLVKILVELSPLAVIKGD
jgi:tRNA-splicing ligase RtcB